MAGTNNFQQWNPTAANQESDAAYTSDSLRSGGAGTGAIFPSVTANKLFFQLAQMVTALSQMMANKTYNMSDANLANLTAALANIVTNHDVPGYLVRVSDYPGGIVQFTNFTQSLTANGWTKLPNGLIIMWGLSNAVAGDANSDSVNVNFSPAFTNCFAAFAVANSVSPGSHGGTVVQVTSLSASTMTITMVNADSNNHVGAVKAYWFAVGS